MAISPFDSAINQICDEKKLSRDIVISTIEQALAAAYRKEYGQPRQIIKCEINLDDLGKSKMYQVFNVVNDEDFEDESNQIKLVDAKKKNKKLKIDDEYTIKLPQKSDFGRIAAQTAKQVIIQRLQEAERDILFDEYKEKENTIANAIIQQINPYEIVVNLGRSNAILPKQEQIPNENYRIGQRIKVYVVSVEKSTREAKIIVSRSRPELIEKLFEMEVPEISAQTVNIKSIAREPGARTKISVTANQEGLDPVGSCVGQRGIRIQSVLSEIYGEKIDIILYDKDIKKYIINALSPAKIEKVIINKKEKSAKVDVLNDQLSLAIGKNGQNVRLASKLTGYKIDIIKNAIEENKKIIKKNSKDKPKDK
jgi:N utilization substance protein A